MNGSDYGGLRGQAGLHVEAPQTVEAAVTQFARPGRGAPRSFAGGNGIDVAVEQETFATAGASEPDGQVFPALVVTILSLMRMTGSGQEVERIQVRVEAVALEELGENQLSRRFIAVGRDVYAIGLDETLKKTYDFLPQGRQELLGIGRHGRGHFS